MYMYTHHADSNVVNNTVHAYVVGIMQHIDMLRVMLYVIITVEMESMRWKIHVPLPLTFFFSPSKS